MTGAATWRHASIADGSRFDAIVVGSGAAGGVAATALAEAGMRVAVLEAGDAGPGRINPVTKALTAVARFLDRTRAESRMPPSLARFGERAFRLLGRARQPVQSRCFAWAMAPNVLVDDRDCPYQTEDGSQFLWFRARQPGGRMTVPGHGRQYYRLSGMKSDGSNSADNAWPFALEDVADWYGWVEDKLQLRGGDQAVPGPDTSRLAGVLQPTPSEQAIIGAIRSRWPRARPVLGNFAPPLSWLDIAAGTGRMAFQAGAVVRRVLKDPSGAVSGVEWIDGRTGAVRTVHAPVVFLCASAIESTRILLLSRTVGDDAGIGTESPALGRHLMDHAVMSGTGYRAGSDDVLPEQAEPGRCIHIPPDPSLHPSISMQIHVHPRPDGAARVDIVSFAEMLPDPWNRVTLSPSQTDRYGIPVPVIRFRHSAEQRALADRQAQIIRELSADIGLTDVIVNTDLSPGGTSVHECGTARMGTDPATSVVDMHNECWDVPGLYVTDGACFPRQHVHNPTLTMMMLTARAAAHAAAR